jgi:hypothetical protein
VSELVCGPVEAPARSHDGLSELDVLMERLYALNILGQGRYAPSLELWQVGDVFKDTAAFHVHRVLQC